MKPTAMRVSVLGLVLPLLFTASASAQSGTLVITPSTAAPGQSVTVTGGNFASGPNVNSVAIRLSTRNGQVLSNPSPDGAGNISATFPVPSLAPGTYLILGTQTYSNGRTKSFTPDRGRLQVTAARRRSGSSAGGLIAPIGALIVLAGGLSLVARRRSSLNLKLGSR